CLSETPCNPRPSDPLSQRERVRVRESASTKPSLSIFSKAFLGNKNQIFGWRLRLVSDTAAFRCAEGAPLNVGFDATLVLQMFP
ncbi:MAG: hypothetical protein JWM68_2300, partial [Verrucomicrobiales bacterium]|nr:hypothetical protein [Verrucomicrobiales bacterium]